jgi:hypothetical protein
VHIREKLRSASGLRVSLKSSQSLLLHHPARVVSLMYQTLSVNRSFFSAHFYWFVLDNG